MPRLRGGAANAYIGADNILRTSQASLTLGLPSTMLGGDGTLLTLSPSLRPRVSAVRSGPHWLWVGTEISGTFILAHDEALEIDRATIGNLPLAVGYGHTLVDRADGLVVRVGPTGSVAVPIDASQRAVLDLATSLGLVADMNFPLSRGAWWNGIFLRGSVGWGHAFLDDAPGTPTGAAGDVFQADISSARFVPRDRISLGLAAWINVWQDLSIGNSWSLGLPFNYPPATEDCVPVIGIDCAEIDEEAETGSSYEGTMQLSVGYLFAGSFWAQLAYTNNSSENARKDSIFYSPYATLSLSGTLLIDHLLARMQH